MRDAETAVHTLGNHFVICYEDRDVWGGNRFFFFFFFFFLNKQVTTNGEGRELHSSGYHRQTQSHP